MYVQWTMSSKQWLDSVIVSILYVGGHFMTISHAILEPNRPVNSLYIYIYIYIYKCIYTNIH